MLNGCAYLEGFLHAGIQDVCDEHAGPETNPTNTHPLTHSLTPCACMNEEEGIVKNTQHHHVGCCGVKERCYCYWFFAPASLMILTTKGVSFVVTNNSREYRCP